MLCTLGDLLEDVVVWLRSDPVRGSETNVRSTRRRGGSAANVAALAAQAGGKARFVGQVGDDPTGAELIASMQHSGVDTQVTRSGLTGTTVVLVGPDGETTKLTDRGVLTQLGAVPDGVLDGVRILHIPAYSLTTEPLSGVAYSLVGEAMERGIAVTVDASSVSELRDFGVAEFLGLMEQLRPHVFFCNRAESKALGLNVRSPAPGAGCTVVKAGPRPTLVVMPDGETLSIPVKPVADIVDTTGAGDAFAAGYLLASSAGQDIPTCVAAAHLLASRVLRSYGVSLGQPK